MKELKIRVQTQRYKGGAVEVTLVGCNGQPVAKLRAERQVAVDTKGTDAYAVTYLARVNDGLPHQQRYQGATDVVRVPRVKA